MSISHYPIPLTAASEAELAARTTAVLDRLDRLAGPDRDGTNGTVDVGRIGAELAAEVDPAAPWRRLVLAADAAQAAAALRDQDPRWVLTRCVAGADGDGLLANPASARVAFLFSGFGKLSVSRGSDLYACLPRFRAVVDQLCAVLVGEFGIDPRPVLFGSASDAQVPEYEEALRRNRIGHPALFLLEYALACTWRDWGVRPAAMLAHSLGEYVVAAVAGVLSPEDALRLVAGRAEMVEELPEGRMLAVSLPRDGVEAHLEEGVSVAATNGPDVTIVAGPVDRIAALQQWYTNQGVRCGLLSTTHAFHTGMLEPIRPRLVELAGTMTRRPPRVRYVSCVTGTLVTPRQATEAEYWGRHMCSPVLFHEGLRTLWRRPPTAVVEVGPEQTATAMASRFVASENAAERPLIASLAPSPYWDSATLSLLSSAGRLWLTGVSVDWGEVYRDLCNPTVHSGPDRPGGAEFPEVGAQPVSHNGGVHVGG